MLGGLMGMFDPENADQLAMALSLLGAKKGDNLGVPIQQFANAQMRKKQLAQQEAMQKMQMERGSMEMDQMRRQMAEQEALRGAAGQAFRPPVEPQGPMPDGGNMPMIPGGGGMPDFAQRAMAINPMVGMQYLPKPQAPKFHNVNGNLVREPTAPGEKAEPVFTAPREPKDWENPAYQEFQLRRAKAGASRVNVNNAQETEFNKKVGGHFAEQFNNLLSGAGAANNQLRDLQRFESIVSKVPTGKLEPIKSEVSKLAKSLGVEVDTKTLGFQEALESMSNQFALTLRNPEGGAGMPGALSDKDREFLVSMVPTLAKTPQGNSLIIEGFKRVAQRKIEVAKLAREYKAARGRFDEGFYDVLEQKFGSTDLLGDLYDKASSATQTVIRFDRNGNQVK